jgi:serine/threonine protein kinase
VEQTYFFIAMGGKMLRAIESLHKVGYIHCDIKSENFILTPDMSEIILIDFGL